MTLTVRVQVMMLIVVFVQALTAPQSARADGVHVGPDAAKPSLAIHAHTAVPGHAELAGDQDSDADPIGTGVRDIVYEWRRVCSNRAGSTGSYCTIPLACQVPDESRWSLYSRQKGSTEWQLVTTACRSVRPATPAPGADPPKPTITPAMIRHAVKTIGLPHRKIHIQPAHTTLVNLATIYSTTTPHFDHGIELLGFHVHLKATPTTYAWHTGDGTAMTTNGPGDPWPHKTITHKYRTADVTVHPRVDITYRIGYRIDSGDWQHLNQTLTATGPSTDLAIKEATPLLTSGR